MHFAHGALAASPSSGMQSGLQFRVVAFFKFRVARDTRNAHSRPFASSFPRNARINFPTSQLGQGAPP